MKELAYYLPNLEYLTEKWDNSPYNREEYREMLTHLAEMCLELGENPHEIAKDRTPMWWLTEPSDKEAQRKRIPELVEELLQYEPVEALLWEVKSQVPQTMSD